MKYTGWCLQRRSLDQLICFDYAIISEVIGPKNLLNFGGHWAILT